MKPYSFSGMYSEKTQDNGQKLQQVKFWLSIREHHCDSDCPERFWILHPWRFSNSTGEQHPEQPSATLKLAIIGASGGTR